MPIGSLSYAVGPRARNLSAARSRRSAPHPPGDLERSLSVLRACWRFAGPAPRLGRLRLYRRGCGSGPARRFRTPRRLVPGDPGAAPHSRPGRRRAPHAGHRPGGSAGGGDGGAVRIGRVARALDSGGGGRDAPRACRYGASDHGACRRTARVVCCPPRAPRAGDRRRFLRGVCRRPFPGCPRGGGGTRGAASGDLGGRSCHRPTAKGILWTGARRRRGGGIVRREEAVVSRSPGGTRDGWR